MNDYTPTTEEVQGAYVRENDTGHPLDKTNAREEFDRWLAEHDAQVREEALAPIRAARANHPVCKRTPEDSAFECGWKMTVLDIDKALEES